MTYSGDIAEADKYVFVMYFMSKKGSSFSGMAENQLLATLKKKATVKQRIYALISINNSSFQAICMEFIAYL